METTLLLLTAIIAGIITHWVSVILQRGPVMASALVVLTSGLILPAFFADLGTELALVATTASYAGMASKDWVASPREMGVVGLLCGVLYIAGRAAYPGVGGRLGTIAAIACLAWLGARLLARRQQRHSPSK